MITNNELNAVQLSATKKDYYQIWNELIEIAGKISNRWDPATTNESDPGVVLLKVLTAIADKLNYNIDVNTLEAFMPSAAQMESMRALCEMMGYNIKYYRSATSEITMKYIGDAETQFAEINEITLPMFSAISNLDKDVNYVTVEAKNFSADNILQTIQVIEGQHVQCETINNNIVTIDLLDDNHRFYLPEHQIAENGIFVYRITDGNKSERWEQKDNLHTQHFNSLIYKFGYDSKESRPYIQFPEDIGQIIGDGLEIHYIRTSGIAGNIAAYTLSQFEKPSDDSWKQFNNESDFKIMQLTAATNGANIETITEAYQGFKKTIGTFDTLITCRDYMNKIYNMLEENNNPMVSNVIVSDIRDDINRAINICSFNDFGICYTDKSIVKDTEDLINHFDLVIYPFNAVYGQNSKFEYENSFKYNGYKGLDIEYELANNKTIAHQIKYPNDDEIVLIKNYLKLDAKITTTKKVNSQEADLILMNIKNALYRDFNLRKLDFGEEIPFDALLDSIEFADTRIKNVVLNEPILYTKFATASGVEYDNASVLLESPLEDNTSARFPGRELYNKLLLRNILAGRLELFNYNKDFNYSLEECAYSTANTSYSAIYPGAGDVYVDENDNVIQKTILSIEPSFTLGTGTNGNITIPENYELQTNQEIEFRMPNFKTDITYPAYVNYHLKLATSIATAAEPARFDTLKAFMSNNSSNPNSGNNISRWAYLPTFVKEALGTANTDETLSKMYKPISKNESGEYNSYLSYIEQVGALYTRSTDRLTYSIVTDATGTLSLDNTQNYYYFELNKSSLMTWKSFIQAERTNSSIDYDLYRALSPNAGRIPGYLVDTLKNKYQLVTELTFESKDYLIQYFIPSYFGVDAVYTKISPDSEYQLQRGEYLLINYTPSSSTTAEDGSVINSEGQPISICYGPGCIIKPNFELSDSEALYNAKIKAYSKTLDFTNCSKKGLPVTINNIDKIGMFGLGANEKIEHRNIASVTLDKEYYLYWSFNSPISEVNAAMNRDKRYILKENEYFFIASKNKDAMSYYGNGTEISLTSQSDTNSAFFDETISSVIALEDILIDGIAGVPWKHYSFNANKYLVITEYQYITLNNGDVLTNIDVQNPLSATWQPADCVSYIIAGESKTLPSVNINKLLLQNKLSHENKTSNYLQESDVDWNSIALSGKLTWEVKSALLLQTSKENSIKLLDNETIKINWNVGDSTLLAGNTTEPVIIQTNYQVNGSFDKIDTQVTQYDERGEEINVNDFKLKVSMSRPLGITFVKKEDTNYVCEHKDSALVNLHNFGENLTNIHFNRFYKASQVYEDENNKKINYSRENYLELFTNIPANNYGLLMIYYSGKQDTGIVTNTAYIKATFEDSANIIPLSIFNNKATGNNKTAANRTTDFWWTNRILPTPSSSNPINTDSKYHLRRGVNIIKLYSTVKSIKIYPDKDLADNIVFSDLSIIWETDDLNFSIFDYQDELKYYDTSSEEIKNITWTIQREESNIRNASEVISYNPSTDKATYHANGLKRAVLNMKDIRYFTKDITPNILSEHEQLLNTLNELDINHEFYYNHKLDNSLAIDINESLINTEDAEIMSTPRLWYDSNNINNKFVVSEIDTNYNGITIARSSKL